MRPPDPRGGPDLLTFGEAMAVLVADAGSPLAAATRFTRTVAGSESNVAVGVARAGHAVRYWSRVGADALGDAVLAALRADGVDVSRVVVDPDAPTGLLLRDAHAERPVEVAYYRTGSAASRLGVDDVDLAEVARARVLFATGITPLLSERCADLTREVVAAARAAGTLVAFDPNLRRRLLAGREPSVLLPAAGGADVVLTGLQEGEAVTGAAGPEGVAAALLRAGARLVVVKLGADGAWASDGDRAWSCRPGPVRVVDPVGAGDAFDAGFLAALLDGLDVPAALERGALLGRFAVQAVGDTEGLPTRRQLAVLRAGTDVVR